MSALTLTDDSDTEKKTLERGIILKCETDIWLNFLFNFRLESILEYADGNVLGVDCLGRHCGMKIEYKTWWIHRKLVKNRDKRWWKKLVEAFKPEN